MLVRHRPDAAVGRADAPLPDDRRPGGVRTDRPPVPRARARRRAPVRRRAGGRTGGSAVRLDRRRVLGQLPRTRLGRELLPRRGRRPRRTRPHLAGAARPGLRRPRRAAAARRPARHRRGASSATCTPTTAPTSAATTCCASTTPTARSRASRSAARRATAERMAAAYGLPADPGMTGEFEFRTYAGPVQVGPLTVEPVPVVHPVAGLRPARHGRRAHPRLLRRHRAVRRPGLARRGRGPAARRGVVPSPTTKPSGDPPDRRGRRPGGGHGRRGPARAHPRAAVVRPGAGGRRGQGAVRRPHRAGHRGRGLTTCPASACAWWSAPATRACSGVESARSSTRVKASGQVPPNGRRG